MIDIKQLRQHPETFKASAQARGVTVDVDKLVQLDAQRTKLIGDIEALRAQLNVKGKPTPEQQKQLQDVKAKLELADKEYAHIDGDYQDLLWQVPNLLADGTPEGGEEANREERTWGDPKPQELDHLQLSAKHDWLDFERGAKVAGSKFYFVKGAPVRLELAVTQMALDRLQKAGFTPMQVPHMVTDRIAAGAGFLPRGEERQVYKVEGSDLNLIATAEAPLTGYHADEIIDPASLPLLYAGISPCYRLEAGSYGRHSNGLYRVHQFNKLEMYVYTTPEASAEWLQKILEIEEQLAQELEIPYRVVRIAAGDLGAPAYQKYDLEYWSPVDGQYRELTSCSNCTDFQSRRLNIRTRGVDGKTEPVHTLNGTAFAFSRLFIALVENHQTADGQVRIPKALQPYYGGETL